MIKVKQATKTPIQWQWRLYLLQTSKVKFRRFLQIFQVTSLVLEYQEKIDYQVKYCTAQSDSIMSHMLQKISISSFFNNAIQVKRRGRGRRESHF